MMELRTRLEKGIPGGFCSISDHWSLPFSPLTTTVHQNDYTRNTSVQCKISDLIRRRKSTLNEDPRTACFPCVITPPPSHPTTTVKHGGNNGAMCMGTTYCVRYDTHSAGQGAKTDLRLTCLPRRNAEGMLTFPNLLLC